LSNIVRNKLDSVRIRILSTLPKRICTKIRKAIPLDPRQQFAFATDLTVRGKAALRDAGMALVSVPAIAEQSP